ncbi:MAG TPA: HAD hydrolase-like protein [Planctomycetota bacterium]|jgi:phosphoglycolate phosphatase-like HAD superfamily hydrolase
MSEFPSLASFKPSAGKRFFIGFDSDGCVFDTMETKHKECFAPVTIWKWDLQAVSRYARECHEFVNLYSKYRGINRFPAVVRTLELLAQRPQARARGYKLPELRPLKEWIATEKALGNSTLKACVARTADPELKRTLEWSEAINARVEEMVYGVPPFPGVREFLEAVHRDCDMIVVSATPTEALNREWREHEIEKYVHLICGQELGSKEEHLRGTCAGRYAAANILVVGDAFGDYRAARANGALFFPILPGNEEASWARLLKEAWPRLTAGTYAGEYQEALIREMDRILPEKPPFETQA